MPRVGYVPYSKDLSHPGDRRRLAEWALNRDTKLITDNPLDSDILFLSNAANFGYWLKRAKQPVVLDLVDAYLGEKPTFLKDVIRNIVRTIKGTSHLKWITYTNHLKVACQRSAAIVVASPEQRDLILPFNKNVYVILDNHSEIDDQVKVFESKKSGTDVEPSRPYIFWEGFGYTLKHFKFIAKELDAFLSANQIGLHLVTVPSFPRWGGYIGKIQSDKMMKEILPKSASLIEIIPWSLENLVSESSGALYSIIPLDPEDKFAALKSENKLLSNWHLGIFTVFSNTPAYSRVAKLAEANFGMTTKTEWTQNLSDAIQSKNEIIEVLTKTRNYLANEHSSNVINANWDLCVSEVTNLN